MSEAPSWWSPEVAQAQAEEIGRISTEYDETLHDHGEFPEEPEDGEENLSNALGFED